MPADPPPARDEVERVAFEKWWDGHYLSVEGILGGEPSQASRNEEAAWAGWQASASHREGAWSGERREPRNDEERAVWDALDRAHAVVTKQAEAEQRNAVPLSEVMDFVVRAAAVGMRAGRRPGWGQEAMDLRAESDRICPIPTPEASRE